MDYSAFPTAQGRHLWMNIDINSGNTPFLQKLVKTGDFSESAFWPYVDPYKNSQVTDLLFCIFCQYSAAPSKVFTTSVDKYHQKLENGHPVDYTTDQVSPYENYTFAYELAQRGLDPYAIWIKRCRTLGIRPWISIRMNDAHCPDEETSFLRSDFFYEAREKGWMIGEHYGYFRNCLNYAMPQVRQKMLDYLQEQLNQYDTDGIELDFLREIYCFDYVHQKDAPAIMNAFMEQFSELVKQAELRWHHPIRKAVRVMRDLDQNLIFGLDLRTWANRGWVDAVNVSPRWATCDSDMPIAQWKKALPNVEITAGIETLLNRQEDAACADPDAANGFAAAYLSQGADAVYLFNYFFFSSWPGARTEDLIHRCGNLETATRTSRRHIMSWQDMVPEGIRGYHPLPVEINGSCDLSLLTGLIPEGAHVSLILGTDSEAALHPTVNGQLCGKAYPCSIYGYSESTGQAVEGGYCPPGTHGYVWDITGFCENTRQSICVESDAPVTLTYCEIRVNP